VSVVLIDSAIQAMFRNPLGPVARDIERRAQAVVEEARYGGPKGGINGIMGRFRDVQQLVDSVGYELVEGPLGIEAVVGLQGKGSITDYLNEKEHREHVWLVPALQAARV
jgi:hypothetical protein